MWFSKMSRKRLCLYHIVNLETRCHFTNKSRDYVKVLKDRIFSAPMSSKSILFGIFSTQLIFTKFWHKVQLGTTKNARSLNLLSLLHKKLMSLKTRFDPFSGQKTVHFHFSNSLTFSVLEIESSLTPNILSFQVLTCGKVRSGLDI